MRRPTEIERLFAFVLENAPLIVFEIDGSGTILFSDGAALASAGLRPGQHVGEQALDHYGAVPWLRDLIERAARGEAVAATGASGGLWFSVYGAPARGQGGEIDGALAIAFDVTPFKQREIELRASEDRLRSLSEATSEAIGLHAGGVLLFANRAASAISGYAPEELIGKPIFELTPAAERERLAAHIASGRVDPIRVTLLCKDGSEVPCDLRAGNVTWNRAPARLVAFRDLRQQDAALMALRRAEDSFRNLIESSPDGIVVHRNGRIVYVNGQVVERGRHGSAAAMVGRSIYDLLHPDDHAMVAARLEQIERSDGPGPAREIRLFDASGEVITFESRSVRVHFDGEPAVLAVLRDLTERKRTTDLREGEGRVLQHIAAGAPLSVILDDICLMVESVLSGIRTSILLVDEATGLLRPMACPNLPAAYVEALRGIDIGPGVGTCGTAMGRGEIAVTPDIGSDPAWAPLAAETIALGLRACTSVPILGADGKVLGTFANYSGELRRPDASELELMARAGNLAGIAVERRRADDALRASEARYRTLVESLEEVVYRTDHDGKFTFLNPAWTELTGWGVAESLGRSWLDCPIAEDQPAALQALRSLVEGGVAQLHLECRYLSRQGELRFVEIDAQPLRNESGEVVGTLGTMSDVTRRRKLEAQLQVSDRLASLGTLAAGVAHEINNPLGAVVANLEHAAAELRELLGRGEPVAAARLHGLDEALTDAREASTRVRNIVRDLKVFARGEDERRGPVDVIDVIEKTLRMATNEVRARAQLRRELGPIPLVDGNEARLGQVVLNLVINAAHAIPEGAVDRHEITVMTATDDRGNAVIEVRDTGVGISPEVQRRVFDPFFTTKAVGIGTGLGLAISHRIVAAMGGTIEVRSELGKGSAFRLVLPPSAAAALPAERRGGLSASHPLRRRGRILVVDDEPMICTVVQRVLQREHDVTAFVRPEDALAAIRSGQRYDLILCDLMMPGLTGMDLYDAILLADPTQAERMVFLTGGAFTARARAFVDQVANPLLEKPFDVPSLYALVRDRL